MAGFLWIFIQRTTGVIRDSPDVRKESISLDGEYESWIIGHYHLWIILAIIVFNIFNFLPYYTKETNKKAGDSNINAGTPKE